MPAPGFDGCLCGPWLGSSRPASPALLVTPTASLSRPFRLFFEQRTRVFGGLAATFAAAIALLQLPGLARRALDTANAGADDGAAGRLWSIVGLFAAFALAEALLRMLGRLLLVGASRRMEQRLKDDLFAHLQRAAIADLDRLHAGEALGRATQDVELVRFATGPALLYLGQAVVLLPGGVLTLYEASPGLALSAAIPLLGMGLGLWRLAPRIQARSAEVQAALGELSARAGEVFAAFRAVRAARSESTERQHLEVQGSRIATGKVELARTRARADLAIHAGVEVAVLAGLAAGGYAVVRGEATSGELLELYALLGLALTPLLAVGFVVGAAPRAAAAGRRIEELFLLPTDEVAAGVRTTDTPLEGDAGLRAHGLTVQAPDSDRALLADVTFTAPPGSTLGIVGPVGGGKSALLDALLGFRPLAAGTLSRDGTNLGAMRSADRRSLFALVAQDSFLFAGTLAENVAFGNPDATPDQIVQALRRAGLGADLARWPDGPQTRLGERGVTLSGGQRQRLALARALCAARPVLLLDDPLAAVDAETERRILAGLRNAEVGAPTLLIVSHRLSAVRDADRILVLEDGRITAAGRHEDLVDREGYYREAWRLQGEDAALDGPLAGFRERDPTEGESAR